MGVDVALVENLFPVVLVDVLLSSHPACKDEGKGGEGVSCEDCIAKERSREETPESFEVDDTCGVVRGVGGLVIDREASVDVLNGGDDLLDGE